MMAIFATVNRTQLAQSNSLSNNVTGLSENSSILNAINGFEFAKKEKNEKLSIFR
jgi:hypothetical protein